MRCPEVQGFWLGRLTCKTLLHGEGGGGRPTARRTGLSLLLSLQVERECTGRFGAAGVFRVGCVDNGSVNVASGGHAPIRRLRIISVPKSRELVMT